MKRVLIIGIMMMSGLKGYCQDKYYGINLAWNDGGVIELGVTKGFIDWVLSDKLAISGGYNYFDKHFENTISYSYGIGLVLGADVNVKYKSETEFYLRPKIGVGGPGVYGIFYARDIRLSQTGCSGDVLLLEVNIPFKVSKKKNENTNK